MIYLFLVIVLMLFKDIIDRLVTYIINKHSNQTALLIPTNPSIDEEEEDF